MRLVTDNGDYIPTPFQTDFHNMEQRFKLAEGGVRNGKSVSCIAEGISMSLQYPGNVGLVARKSYTEIKDTLWPLFQLMCEQIPHKVNNSDLIITFYNGSIVRFRSLETKVKVTKLKGQTLGWAYIDEATDIDYEAFRILRDRICLPGVPHRILLATNPAGFTNWVYEHFHENPMYGSGFVSATTFDNPFLPEDYKDERKRLSDGDPIYYKRMVLGEWGDLEGLVYPMFRSDVHVKSDVPEIMKAYYAGIDWGAENPTVILLAGIDYDNRVYLIKEYYYQAKDSKPSDWIAALRRMTEPLGGAYLYAVADPSGKGYINEFRSQGFAVISGNNDIESGIGAVKEALANNRLFIKPECKYTLKEIQSYIWDDGKDAPIKKNDHCMDAMRYLLKNLNGGGFKLVGKPKDEKDKPNYFGDNRVHNTGTPDAD